MITCLHPQRFYNKYIGAYMSAPCGKCEACISLKALRWKQRLDFESLCHKSTYFITLTYDNEHLPFLDIDSEFETYQDMDKASYNLYEVYDGKLPILQKRDIQLFIKRFRKILFEEYGETFRYYVIGEYGSTTKRPHYHLLLWLDSQQVEQCIESLLYRAWFAPDKSGVESSIGRIDCQLVSSTATGYVSTYTTSNSVLPNIYRMCGAEPFHSQSQSPSIGFGALDRKQVVELLVNGYIDVDMRERTFEKLSVIPIWKSAENQLFPKCYKFSQLSEYGLRIMYQLYVCFSKRTFKESMCVIASCCQGQLNEMFFCNWDTSHIADSRLRFVLAFIFVYFVEEYKDCLHFEYTRFMRQYYQSEDVFKLLAKYGVNFDLWFLSLQHYYSAKELRNLREQLKFQEQCFQENHPECYPYIVDSSFYDNANGLPIGIRNIYLRQFKVSDEVVAVKCDYFFKAKELLYKKIFNDGIKSKVKNDYLAAHPEFNQLY